MKKIPFTPYIVMHQDDAEYITGALTLGADTVEAQMAESNFLLGIIQSQAESLTVLMGLQNSFADAINTAEEQDLSVGELKERLVSITQEFVPETI